jgi:hypothetical protein
MINTRASDADLKKHFAAWLAEQRATRSPLSARRPGRPATNVAITPNHFKSWTEYNVLAVLDLDFCAQVFGISPLTHEKLADLFLECDSDIFAKEWGRAARAKAKEARGCLDVLAAQFHAEASTGEGGPN